MLEFLIRHSAEIGLFAACALAANLALWGAVAEERRDDADNDGWMADHIRNTTATTGRGEGR